jgi:hypothetical protein
MATYTRFIALGDYMTEGMCDDGMVDGHYRGWADRLADVLAEKTAGFSYLISRFAANFCIKSLPIRFPLPSAMLKVHKLCFHLMPVLTMYCAPITNPKVMAEYSGCGQIRCYWCDSNFVYGN